MSDHSPLMVDLALDTPSSYRVWRLSPLWLADQAIVDQSMADMKSYWITNRQSASIPVVWDAFKATARGSFAAAIGQTRKASQSRLVDAEGGLRDAETAYSTSPTPETHSIWRHRARELELVLLEHTQKKLLYQNQRLFEFGDKNISLLAYLARPDYQLCNIPRIMNSEGVVVKQNKEIMEAFVTFYSTLYATRAHYTIVELDDYLFDISLPKLLDH